MYWGRICSWRRYNFTLATRNVPAVLGVVIFGTLIPNIEALGDRRGP